MNASKSYATLPSIKNTEPTLLNSKETKMDETIEMNSTIVSNMNNKMSESHHILPPIEHSTLGLNLSKQKSFIIKPLKTDKINMKNTSSDFIEKSLIIKQSKADRMLGKSRSSGLLSLLPDK